MVPFALTGRGFLVQMLAGAFLCGVFMFSLSKNVHVWLLGD